MVIGNRYTLSVHYDHLSENNNEVLNMTNLVVAFAERFLKTSGAPSNVFLQIIEPEHIQKNFEHFEGRKVALRADESTFT